VKKSTIPWHTVYAVNLERISERLYHPDEPVNEATQQLKSGKKESKLYLDKE